MAYLPIAATRDLFGKVRSVEKAGVNPDLRNVAPFAVELARELAKAEAIRLDPFKHLPAGCRFPSLQAVLNRRRSFTWLSDQSPAYVRDWEAGRYSDYYRGYAKHFAKETQR